MNLQFSVIIPIYKVEQYLTQCVDSVLNQTYKNFEIILVDDGSPDNCPRICDEFAKRYPCVNVIHKENGGLSDTRNVGLKAAIGEYVIFLDSDDWWIDKDFLRKTQSFIDKHKAKDDIDVILFQAKKLYEETGIEEVDTLYDSQTINLLSRDETVKYLISTGTYSMSACTKVLKRKTLIEKQLYFTKGLLGEDLDWFLSLTMNVKNIYAINSINYVYRIRKGSITQTISKKNLTDCIWIMEKWSIVLKQSMIQKEFEIYYYAILAYAYVVALLNYRKIAERYKKDIKVELKKYSFLLKYSVNNRIKLTRVCYRLLGFEITSRLLEWYYQNK